MCLRKTVISLAVKFRKSSAFKEIEIGEDSGVQIMPTGRRYHVSVHKRDVLKAGLGRVLLRHQSTEQRLLFLHVCLEPLNVSVHSLQTIS